MGRARAVSWGRNATRRDRVDGFGGCALLVQRRAPRGERSRAGPCLHGNGGGAKGARQRHAALLGEGVEGTCCFGGTAAGARLELLTSRPPPPARRSPTSKIRRQVDGHHPAAPRLRRLCSQRWCPFLVVGVLRSSERNRRRGACCAAAAVPGIRRHHRRRDERRMWRLLVPVGAAVASPRRRRVALMAR